MIGFNMFFRCMGQVGATPYYIYIGACGSRVPIYKLAKEEILASGTLK